MDATLYVASVGCPWRFLLKEFPRVSTVQRYFYDWYDSGLLRVMPWDWQAE